MVDTWGASDVEAGSTVFVSAAAVVFAESGAAVVLSLAALSVFLLSLALDFCAKAGAAKSDTPVRAERRSAGRGR